MFIMDNIYIHNSSLVITYIYKRATSLAINIVWNTVCSTMKTRHTVTHILATGHRQNREISDSGSCFVQSHEHMDNRVTANSIFLYSFQTFRHSLPYEVPYEPTYLWFTYVVTGRRLLSLYVQIFHPLANIHWVTLRTSLDDMPCFHKWVSKDDYCLVVVKFGGRTAWQTKQIIILLHSYANIMW